MGGLGWLGSLKAVGYVTVRYITYDFLFSFHSNRVPRISCAVSELRRVTVETFFIYTSRAFSDAVVGNTTELLRTLFARSKDRNGYPEFTHKWLKMVRVPQGRRLCYRSIHHLRLPIQLP